MKTFNQLTSLESSRIHSSIVAEHNLKVISTVIHSAIQSSNPKIVRCLSLITETMFSLLDEYIMNHSGDFDENFIKHYKNEIHIHYENETENPTGEDA